MTFRYQHEDRPDPDRVELVEPTVRPGCFVAPGRKIVTASTPCYACGAIFCQHGSSGECPEREEIAWL